MYVLRAQPTIPEDGKTFAGCAACGGAETIHKVFASVEVDASEMAIFPVHEVYEVLQCQGCGSFRFRKESYNTYDLFKEKYGPEPQPLTSGGRSSKSCGTPPVFTR